MDENQNPKEAPKSGTDDLNVAAGDFKEAASANIEHLRQAVGQKADEIGQTAQAKGQEFRGAAESLLSETRLRAKSWHTKGEAYVHANPSKSVLMAFITGLLLGLLIRE
jgi:ElaB/YqjD/DUF883 family membrane-anchored ribosome-binding protein